MTVLFLSLFLLNQMHLKGPDRSRQTQFFVTGKHWFPPPLCKVPSFFDFYFTCECERSLVVLANPKVTYPPTAPTQAPAFLEASLSLLEFRNCWLPFPLTTLFDFMCAVDVIALGWKGLATNDAKKKKSFLLIAHALTMNALYYPHTCLLLLGPSFILRGLFCTSCSGQLTHKGYGTCPSRVHDVVARRAY